VVLIYIFFYIDGPFLFLDAIMQSYKIIPVDQFLSPSFFGPHSFFWTNMLKLFNDVMTLGIQISAPALIAILMTDVFLGIANRLAPQVQITFLGMPLKSLLGLTVVCLGWSLLASELAKESRVWLNYVLDMINHFIPSSP
jgi:type III secretion protein T